MVPKEDYKQKCETCDHFGEIAPGLDVGICAAPDSKVRIFVKTFWDCCLGHTKRKCKIRKENNGGTYAWVFPSDGE